MNKGKKESGFSNKILWSIVSLIIAVLTITAVSRQSSSFSLNSMVEILRNGSGFYMFLAVLSMMGFVFFEGCAIRCILNHEEINGKRVPMRTGFKYAAADVYFSAITPSATGGQPAALVFMKRDGIPFHLCSSALIFNLAIYHVALIFTGLACLILFPGVFMGFNLACKALIIFGYVTLIGLVILFYMLLKKRQILHNFGLWILGLLEKMHLVHNKAKYIDKLDKVMLDYEECSQLFLSDPILIMKVFIYNLLQRVSQLMVTVFMYACIMGGMKDFVKVFVIQSYAVVGSNCIPIPGAMGVIDYLMIDGFSTMMSSQSAVTLELASRGLSFYFCIIICLVIVLVGYFRGQKRKNQTEG